MKRTYKTKLFLEAAVVIAIALALVVPSSAVITNVDTNSMNKLSVKKADFTFQKAPADTGKIFSEGEDIPAASEEGDEHAPAIVRDNTKNRNLWIFYVLEEGIDSDIYMRRSTDDGQTWPEVWYLSIEGVQLGPVATVDSAGFLWVAFIDEEMDSITFLQGQDPSADPTTWEWYYFEPGSATDHKQMGSIATYNSGRTIAAWCYVADIDFPPLFSDAATIEHNGAGEQWTYTWDSAWQDIPSSHPAIGASNDLFFFAFQYTDNITANERINVRWGDAVQQSDMEEWKNEWGMFDTGDDHNSSKPSVSGSGDNAVVIYQSNENGNQDIMCSYTDDDGDTWTHNVVVVDDAEDEENPRVFMSGVNAYCLYIKAGNLYLINSTDGGATWEEPIRINDEDGSVENEWRNVETSFPFIVWTDNRNDDLDIYFDLGGEIPKEPYLEIGEITGGLGVSAVITNDGDAAATNVEWTITVTGGLFGLINKETTDTITTLAVDAEETVKSGLILGLGPIAITLTVTCDEGKSADDSAAGTQLFIFTMVS